MNLNILTEIDHRILGFIASGIIIIISVVIILLRYYKNKK